MTEQIQRALGRIEGTQAQILEEMRTHRAEFTAHQRQDLASLEILAVSIAKQRDDMNRGFAEQDRARNQHLNEQDVKLDGLKADADKAKGAGWVILGLLGAFAAFLGTAVLSVLNGWLKIH